jgi:hypothetical protein
MDQLEIRIESVHQRVEPNGDGILRPRHQQKTDPLVGGRAKRLRPVAHVLLRRPGHRLPTKKPPRRAAAQNLSGSLPAYPAGTAALSVALAQGVLWTRAPNGAEVIPTIGGHHGQQIGDS